MASLAALRSAIRASRATLTASRAVRRSTAAGLSASDLAWAARSSWAFFASAAALRRSAKLAFLDQFISVFYAQENGSWPKGSTVSDRRSPRHIPGMDDTNFEKRHFGSPSWHGLAAAHPAPAPPAVSTRNAHAG